MTRADALFEAAWRWEQRYHDAWVELDGTWPHRLSPRLAGNPMSRRLWCLKHAKRCRTLGLRAMRDEARQERLARYRADLAEHGARTAEQRWLANWQRTPEGA